MEPSANDIAMVWNAVRHSIALLDRGASQGQKAALRANLVMQRRKVAYWMRAFPRLSGQLGSLNLQIGHVLQRIDASDGEFENVLNYAAGNARSAIRRRPLASSGSHLRAGRAAPPQRPALQKTTDSRVQIQMRMRTLRKDILTANRAVTPARAATMGIISTAFEQAIQRAIASGKRPRISASLNETDDDKEKTAIMAVRQKGGSLATTLTRRIEAQIATTRQAVSASQIAQMLAASRNDPQFRDDFEKLVLNTALSIVGASVAAMASNWAGAVIALATLRARMLEYRQLKRKLAEKSSKEVDIEFAYENGLGSFEQLPMTGRTGESSDPWGESEDEAEALAAFELAAL